MAGSAVDPCDLRRFREAQDRGGIYDLALSELAGGRKRGHWIWFVFPQLAGLGSSPTARRYAIRSLDEARAYLADELLGARLERCCEALLSLPPATTAGSVLGELDALKLRSSMTLFGRADPDQPIFGRMLDRFYDGERDPLTERLLSPTEP